jgi:Leucine-rich repeat (LRR) protein
MNIKELQCSYFHKLEEIYDQDVVELLVCNNCEKLVKLGNMKKLENLSCAECNLRSIPNFPNLKKLYISSYK